MAVRIGELLLKEKRITPEQLQEALNYQRQHGGKLGFNLVKLGYVRDDEITALLSKQYGVPSIALGQFEIDASVIKLVPAETAQKYQIVPLSRAGATLTIAMTDPTNVFAMGDVKVLEDLEEISAEMLAKQGEEAPIIKLVNIILMSAIQKGASDIHIEPYEKELRVRYRVDGLLYNIMQPPMKFRDAMTSRIKIMAKLDIAE